MEVVVLGQKQLQKGKTLYRTYQNKKYSQTPMETVKIGDKITTTIEPFPFNTFSSLDLDDDKSFLKFDSCYLLMNTDLTEEQFNKMSSGDRRSYLMENTEATFLGEFSTPFEYALEQYHKYDKLDSYDLVTWLIHEETRNETEFEAMSEILKIDRLTTVAKGYKQDISFDKWVIPYLPQLVDDPNVEFGRYGRFDSKLETLNRIDSLPVDKLLKFVHEYVRYYMDTLLSFWLTHPMLGEAWFWNQLENEDSPVSQVLLNNDYHRFYDIPGFDWKRLMYWRFDMLQRHDSRDLTAYFNSASIEREYQKDNIAYQEYLSEQSDDDEWYDDDYEDDYCYYNDEPMPVDPRRTYLDKYLVPFSDVLNQEDFKELFPMVPDKIWER